MNTEAFARAEFQPATTTAYWDCIERANFIARILAAPPVAKDGARVFRRLLEQDVRALLADASVPGNVATEVLLRLQGIAERLELMGGSASLRQKTVIAVAGGFSSGKTSFVSSFLDDSALCLPVGIQPVTAIPTYVAAGQRSAIRGHTYRGGILEIDPELYSRLSHSYVHGFGFKLRQILPFVAIETPLRGLNHVAFIDLPGYDAATSSDAYTEDDLHQSREFVSQAHGLIWLVGGDTNGEIPASDLDFLMDQQAEGRPLYVVLNKADLRPLDALAEILDQFRGTLEAAGVAYEGIAAYSSVLRTQLRHRGKTLRSFLRDMDQPTDGGGVLNDLNGSFRKLYSAMSRNARSTSDIVEALTALDLDLQELGLFCDWDKSSRRGARGRRSPQRIASQARERLASLQQWGQALKAGDEVERAKAIADKMRRSAKACLGFPGVAQVRPDA